MNIQQATVANVVLGHPPTGSEVIDQERRGPPQSGTVQAEKKVAPDELLKKIKSLTDNGAYSVRFEMDKEIDQLVIRLVDSVSGEMIRQIPSEEMLDVLKSLRDFRGLLVNTQA